MYCNSHTEFCLRMLSNKTQCQRLGTIIFSSLIAAPVRSGHCPYNYRRPKEVDGTHLDIEEKVVVRKVIATLSAWLAEPQGVCGTERFANAFCRARSVTGEFYELCNEVLTTLRLSTTELRHPRASQSCQISAIAPRATPGK